MMTYNNNNIKLYIHTCICIKYLKILEILNVILLKICDFIAELLEACFSSKVKPLTEKVNSLSNFNGLAHNFAFRSF